MAKKSTLQRRSAEGSGSHSPPAPSAPPASPKQLKKFRVELPRCPSAKSEFEAEDEDGAIALFNAFNGIRQTDHKHSVVEVK